MTVSVDRSLFVILTHTGSVVLEKGWKMDCCPTTLQGVPGFMLLMVTFCATVCSACTDLRNSWHTISWKSATKHCVISHLTLVMLLHYLGIRYQSNRHILLKYVGGCEKIVDDSIDDRRIQYSSKFQALTDMSVLHSMHTWSAASWTPISWTSVLLSYLAASKDFDCPNFFWEILSATSVQCILFLGRLPKVDLIILEGKNVRPSVRPSVRPQKVSSISMKFGM